MRRRNVLSNSSPLVEAVVTGKWEKVVDISKDNPDLISARVTVFGETALHMAISDGQTEIVKQLVELMRNNAEQARNALTARNEQGNTPLHLAAAIGNEEMCKYIKDVDGSLIACRNRDGETPLFLAVLHGMKHVIFYLQSSREEDYLLCQRQDGYTILHFALLRDYFGLAIDIIDRYPDLVDAVSEDGNSPLHILATKPSAFRSGNPHTLTGLLYDHVPSKNLLHWYEYSKDWFNFRSASYVLAVLVLDKLLERTSMYKSPDDDGVENQGHEENDEIVESSVQRLPKPLLIAAKNGITEIVERYLVCFPVAVFETDEEMKNIVHVAVEHRQAQVYKLLLKSNVKTAKDTLFRQVDKDGNSVLHLAAKLGDKYRTLLNQDAALHMQREIKWLQYVELSMPPNFFSKFNLRGQTPMDIFIVDHMELVKSGVEWLSKVSKSCSTIAGLISTVTFATSSAVPGGLGPDGTPNLQNQPVFYIFAMASLIALCSSIAALAIFLTIRASTHKLSDFGTKLPLKLLVGYTSLALSAISVSISFCAGHFFIIRQKLKYAALPIYALTGIVVIVVICFTTRFSVYSNLLRSRY